LIETSTEMMIDPGPLAPRRKIADESDRLRCVILVISDSQSSLDCANSSRTFANSGFVIMLYSIRIVLNASS
jgi:hypothetical protein